MTFDEFDSLKTEIMAVAKNTYPDFVVNDIEKIISNIYLGKKDSLIVPKDYRDKAEIEAEAAMKEAQAAEMARIRQRFDHMMTTGFNFEGYRITKYLTVISAEVILGTGFLTEFTSNFSDFFGTQSDSFSQKFQKAKDAVLDKLIAKSKSIGGNAIIGIEFDHLIIKNNMIGVIASGTCVQIEKNYL